METLDNDLVLDPAGHLTDVGATVLADGQSDLLSAAAQHHAATCPLCAQRLGEAALRSLETHDWLEASLLAPAAALLDLAPAHGSTGANEPALLTGANEPARLTGASPTGAAADELRAALVPWWALLGAGATAMLGLALTTSASEMTGLALGVAHALPLVLRTLLLGLQTPELTPRLEHAAFAGAATLWAAGLILGWLATRGRQDLQGEHS